jgi:hypothetical protein
MNNEITTPRNHDLITLSERIAQFKQKAVHTVEIWQPEPGESLVGVLIGHQKAVGAYGESYQILVQDETDNVTAAWLTTWLRENLKAQGANKGDLMALTFLGKKQSPSGRNYNAYSLIVDKS